MGDYSIQQTGTSAYLAGSRLSSAETPRDAGKATESAPAHTLQTVRFDGEEEKRMQEAEAAARLDAMRVQSEKASRAEASADALAEHLSKTRALSISSRPRQVSLADAAGARRSSGAALPGAGTSGGEEAVPEYPVEGRSRSSTTERVVPDLDLDKLEEARIQMQKAASCEELLTILCLEAVKCTIVERASLVSLCMESVEAQAAQGELVLQGWPVVSINEWGVRQERVLVLSTLAVYRLDSRYFVGESKVEQRSRVHLSAISYIEQNAGQMKFYLNIQDGNKSFLSGLKTSLGAAPKRQVRAAQPSRRRETRRNRPGVGSKRR